MCNKKSEDSFLTLGSGCRLSALCLRRRAPSVVQGCYQDSVFILSSHCRKFKVIVARTVSYNIPPISFAYPYKPHSVVSSNGGNLLMRGKGVRVLTRGVYCLVRGSRVHQGVKRRTQVSIRHFGVRRVTRR